MPRLKREPSPLLYIPCLLLLLAAAPARGQSPNKLVRLSQQLMYAAKTDDSTAGWLEQLATLPFNELITQLDSEEEKTAYWINLYNGFTQVLLKQNPESYKNRGKFFSSKQNRVAGINVSLDDIEHGILRRSTVKWSLGHFKKLFPGKTERALRVARPDYRVHFALNCGAKSCPPIAFYDPGNLHTQLEAATRVYLRNETEYDARTRILKLPAIMGWFRRDFGGKRKMITLLKTKKIIPADAVPKIRFKSYDWSIDTSNYSN